ncbi:hypothetical protein LCGC14_0572860 [marine sediment metagenome]|uniref:Uncharacterized protein n=1 Tax=marine sediment metagenome TaxID=412755 RepID=A0A0F9RIS7_9ZZZZ
MTAPTAGPWTFNENAQSWNPVELFGPGETVVVRTYAWEGTEQERIDECLANARLIAAAPELLDACKAVADELSGYVGEDEPGDSGLAWCFDKLREAIAKAEGR